MPQYAIARRPAVAVRRGPSPALAKTNSALVQARSQLSRVRTEVRRREVPHALIGGGIVLGSAAGLGALESWIGDEIAGVPLGVALGLVAATAGVALGMEEPIYAAAGFLAPYAYQLGSDYFSG